MAGAILTWKASDAGPGGVITFDAVLSETLTKTSTVTEFPVEVGANVSDHVRQNLDKLSLEVLSSNTPIRLMDPLTQRTRGSYDAIKLDIPTPPKGFGLSSLISAGLDALFGSIKPQKKALVIAYSTEYSATGEMYDALTLLQEQARLIDVISRDWYLENMIIESVTEPRTPQDGSSARFQVDFKQIRIVETRQTIAPVPLEVRGKKKVSSGSVGAKEVPGAKTKSVLASLADSPKAFGL